MTWVGLVAIAGLGAGIVAAQPFPGSENIRDAKNHGNGFCYSVAAHDIDGDGIEDFLFGEVFDDGPFNTAVNCGAVLVVSGLRPSDSSPRRILLEIFNPDNALDAAVGAGFGWSLAVSRGANGVPIVVASAPWADHPASGAVDVGAVYFFAGSSLAHIGTVYGENAKDRFGFAIADAGDLDGDGLPEFAVGAPGYNTVQRDVGRVSIISGRSQGWTFTVLRTIDGSSPGEKLGTALAGRGTFVPGSVGLDLACGGPGGGSGGRVRMIDPATGAESLLIEPVGGSAAGISLAFAGDHDGNGRDEVLIGDSGRGRVTLHSFETGSSPRWILAGSGSREARFGTSIVLVADLDGDGLRDFAVGAPELTTALRSDRGGVGVFRSTSDFSVPGLLAGRVGPFAGDRYGFALAPTTIRDAVGLPEPGLLVAAPLAAGDGVVDSGTTRLYSLNQSQGQVAMRVSEVFHGTYSGVSSFGEIVTFRRRGDGPDDWIVASTVSDLPGVSRGAANTRVGRVFLLSGRSEPAGKVVRSFAGNGQGESFGSSIVTLAEVPGNGNDRYVLVGASSASYNGFQTGVIRIFDLETGEMTFEYAPSSLLPDAEFGATCVRLGQVFGLRQGGDILDGQIAIGAPGARSRGLAGAGKVFVYNVNGDGTLDVTTEKVLDNVGRPAKTGDRFGAALAGPQGGWIGGSSDEVKPPALLVGAPFADLSIDSMNYRDAGRVFVYGVNLTLSNFRAPVVLDNFVFPNIPTGDLFGFSVAGSGQLLTGGGFEFVVGSPGAECDSLQSVGRVTVFEYTSAGRGTAQSTGICANPQAQSCPRIAEGARFGAALAENVRSSGISDGFWVSAPGFRSPVTGRSFGAVWGFHRVSVSPPCILFEQLPFPDELSSDLGNEPRYGESIAWSPNRFERPGEDDIEGRILIAAPFQDVLDARGYRNQSPRRILDLGKTFMLPLEFGRPRE